VKAGRERQVASQADPPHGMSERTFRRNVDRIRPDSLKPARDMT
jgi:hypothetical protein